MVLIGKVYWKTYSNQVTNREKNRRDLLVDNKVSNWMFSFCFWKKVTASKERKTAMFIRLNAGYRIFFLSSQYEVLSQLGSWKEVWWSCSSLTPCSHYFLIYVWESGSSEISELVSKRWTQRKSSIYSNKKLHSFPHHRGQRSWGLSSMVYIFWW